MLPDAHLRDEQNLEKKAKQKDCEMVALNRREWMFLAFILIYSFIPTFGGLLRVIELMGGFVIVPENPRAIADPVPIVLHVIGSFVFCLLGAFQFVPSIRRKHLNWHRTLGKWIAAAGCISALTGLWMAVVFDFPNALQGFLLLWARILLSVAMVLLIVWAVMAAWSGNIVAHRSAMLRAYAIGQGASTQAFLGIGWMLLTGSESIGMARDLLMVAAWGLNLLIAECLLIRRLASKPKTVSGLGRSA